MKIKERVSKFKTEHPKATEAINKTLVISAVCFIGMAKGVSIANGAMKDAVINEPDIKLADFLIRNKVVSKT